MMSYLYVPTNPEMVNLGNYLVQFSYPDRPLVDEPYVISYIKTKYRVASKLLGVCCLNEEQIWTCGYNDRATRLYNLQGELVESIQIKSGSMPWYIALTSTKDLVYTDIYDGTVKNTQIQTIVKLRGLIPHNICGTSSGDILVVLIRTNKSVALLWLNRDAMYTVWW